MYVSFRSTCLIFFKNRKLYRVRTSGVYFIESGLVGYILLFIPALLGYDFCTDYLEGTPNSYHWIVQNVSLIRFSHRFVY